MVQPTFLTRVLLAAIVAGAVGDVRGSDLRVQSSKRAGVATAVTALDAGQCISAVFGNPCHVPSQMAETTATNKAFCDCWRGKHGDSATAVKFTGTSCEIKEGDKRESAVELWKEIKSQISTCDSSTAAPARAVESSTRVACSFFSASLSALLGKTAEKEAKCLQHGCCWQHGHAFGGTCSDKTGSSCCSVHSMPAGGGGGSIASRAAAMEACINQNGCSFAATRGEPGVCADAQQQDISQLIGGPDATDEGDTVDPTSGGSSGTGSTSAEVYAPESSDETQPCICNKYDWKNAVMCSDYSTCDNGEDQLGNQHCAALIQDELGCHLGGQTRYWRAGLPIKGNENKVARGTVLASFFGLGCRDANGAMVLRESCYHPGTRDYPFAGKSSGDKVEFQGAECTLTPCYDATFMTSRGQRWRQHVVVYHSPDPKGRGIYIVDQGKSHPIGKRLLKYSGTGSAWDATHYRVVHFNKAKLGSTIANCQAGAYL